MSDSEDADTETVKADLSGVAAMSYIFDAGDNTIWSPSLRTGRLYVALSNCLAEIEDRPTGLSAVAEDMYEIEPESFRALIDRVFDDFFSTDHHVYRSQLRGWLLTSLVLLDRAGVTITPTSEEGQELLQDLDVFAKAMPM